MKKLILFVGFAAVLLSSMACMYPTRQTKEVVLQQNLWTMRRAIDFYRADRKRPLESLQELIAEGYLREIPVDPITKSNQTWVIERGKESSIPDSSTGIVDVHSGAAGADSNGKPYGKY
jgi:general secretion pathway protein G